MSTALLTLNERGLLLPTQLITLTECRSKMNCNHTHVCAHTHIYSGIFVHKWLKNSCPDNPKAQLRRNPKPSSQQQSTDTYQISVKSSSSINARPCVFLINLRDYLLHLCFLWTLSCPRQTFASPKPQLCDYTRNSSYIDIQGIGLQFVPLKTNIHTPPQNPSQAPSPSAWQQSCLQAAPCVLMWSKGKASQCILTAAAQRIHSWGLGSSRAAAKAANRMDSPTQSSAADSGPTASHKHIIAGIVIPCPLL